MPPGSPPSEIAAALGIPIVERELEHPLVRASSNRVLRCIWVAPQPYGPRREISLGHELVELALANRLEDDQHELFCQRGAAALVMPRAQFIPDAERLGWDLAALRRTWRHASWQALATRAADLLEHVTASAWEGDRRTFLRGVRRMSGRAVLLEAQAAAEAMAGKGKSEKRLPGVIARAWRIGKARAVSICAVSE